MRSRAPASCEVLQVAEIRITVSRKRIKHVHLRVHAPDGRVTISAPVSTRLRTLETFSASRLEWIRRQQRRLNEQATEAPKQYDSGESHYLWGRRHVLSVVESEGGHRVTIDNRRLTLFTQPGSDYVRRAHVMHAWHKSILREALPLLIQKWEQRLNVQVKGYYLRRMTTRWGTCNYRTKRIRLNTELVTKPSYLLEYVVVHEMVHLSCQIMALASLR